LRRIRRTHQATLRSRNRRKRSRPRSNALNGYQLWSETFDRELKDILALQTEIAAAVTEALKVELLPEDNSKLIAGGTSDPEAYDAYLRGMTLANDKTDEARDRAAMAAFAEAVRLDPQFALAHAGYARSLGVIVNDWIGDDTESRKLLAMARMHADRAVELAPTLSAGRIAGEPAAHAGEPWVGRATSGVLAAQLVDFSFLGLGAFNAVLETPASRRGLHFILTARPAATSSTSSATAATC